MEARSESVGSIMRSPLVTIPPELSVREALEYAQGHRVHHLAVMRQQMLLGLVCTCDMYEASVDSQIAGVMSSPPVAVDHDSSALDAAHVLASRGVGSVIVTVEGAPRGIVTRGDLLRHEPRLEAEMGPCRCDCCGLTRHLRSDSYGQTLCIYCRERSSDIGWLELGDASG